MTLNRKNTYELLSYIACSSCVIQNDEDFTILYANNEFYNLLGYTQEEVNYKFANRLCALLDPKAVKKFRTLLSHDNANNSVRLEHRIKNNKSLDLWLCSVISFSQLEEHNVLHMISQDISTYKQQSFELAHLKKKTDIFFETSSSDVMDYSLESGKIQHIFSKNLFLDNPSAGDTFPNVLLENNFISSTFKDTFLGCVQKLQQGETKAFCEIKMKNYNDQEIWIMLSLSLNTEPPDNQVVAIFTNINTEKEATLNYLQETLFYQSILNNQDAYGHVDVTENKTLRVGGLWSPYNDLINNITYTELVIEYVYKVVHIEDRDHYAETMACTNLVQAYENGITHLTCEFRRIVEQNKMVWMRISIELFKNPINQHLVGLLYLKNINSEKQNRSSFDVVTGYDANTNLHNKAATITAIKEYLYLMNEANYFAFILININTSNFASSQHNDDLDETVLLQASHLLSRAFRKYDIIGHFGGELFLVLVKNIENVQSVEERLDSLLQCSEAVGNAPLSISIGVMYGTKYETFDLMFNKSWHALARAQRSKENTYCTYDDQDSNLSNIPFELPPLNVAESSSVFHSGRSDEFSDFLGEYGDIAYLVDPKTFVLLCGNKAFYERIGRTEQECAGLKCYELLHHRTVPCPFCGNASWSADKFYMYRNYNEVLEQEFLIKNKLVQWQSREVLFAIAVDLSNDKSYTAGLVENDITEDRAIINGIQHMQLASSLSDVFQVALEAIGKYFRSRLVQFWIMNKENNGCQLAYSWAAKDSDHALCNPTEAEVEQVSHWLNTRKWTEKLVIDNRESMLCNSYDMYHRMEKYDFHNQSWFLAADENSKELGFVEINDIAINFRNASFMRSFLHFIMAEWQKRKTVDALIHSGFYDRMTNLLNRISFEKFISDSDYMELNSIGVIFINIDGLKKINESLGYQVGNHYILELANILTTVFSSESIFRISGDEFLVIQTDVEQREIERGIAQLQDSLSDLKLFSVSIGYAWDNVEIDVEQLLEYATQSMKVNKARYYASLETNTQERVDLFGWTMDSIENGSMRIYLQSKIDIRSGKMIGAEALIRYKDKDGAIIPPGKFIQPLEQGNLIRYIDLFVFEEVCRLLERWKKEGKSCPRISLNFSRITMAENDLITSIEAIFKKYSVSREFIEIEITESYADIGKALLNQSVQNLHTAGYPIALDDFGTKYTNLTILSQIDAQVLKIDRSLVSSLETDTRTRTILKNIIQMCYELGIEVIAEGVETQAQENVLKSLGCHLIQGYLYSRPIQVCDFEAKYFTPCIDQS